MWRSVGVADHFVACGLLFNTIIKANFHHPFLETKERSEERRYDLDTQVKPWCACPVSRWIHCRLRLMWSVSWGKLEITEAEITEQLTTSVSHHHERLTISLCDTSSCMFLTQRTVSLSKVSEAHRRYVRSVTKVMIIYTYIFYIAILRWIISACLLT